VKTLIISPYPVFPLKAGGKIRTVQLARSLSELGVDVTLMTPFHFTQTREKYEQESFALKQVPYPFVYAPLLTDRVFPYAYVTSYHPGLKFLIGGDFLKYDIYQFEHAQFASLVDFIPADKIVLYDAHNVEVDYVYDECKSKRSADFVRKRIYKKESKLVNRATHIFACSATDRKRLCKLYSLDKSKVSIIPNGVSSPSLQPSSSSSQVPSHFRTLQKYRRWCIFSGSSVEHNRIAVDFILSKLVPDHPQLAFILHGACSNQFIDNLSPNVFIDKNPDNFQLYAQKNAIGLNPVSTGSGTNLKVIYYLSHGIRVLSTPFGMRGYEDLCDYVLTAPLDDFSYRLSQDCFPLPPNEQLLQNKYGWLNSAKKIREVYLQKRFFSTKSLASALNI
jgi:glycosyltransferase involved in cell wall biosynthesis